MVNAAVGTVSQLNVSVPDPCAVHIIPDSAYASTDAGAGDTTTILLAVTPVTLIVCELLLHPATVRVPVALEEATASRL